MSNAILLVQLNLHAVGAGEVAPELVAAIRTVGGSVTQLGEVDTLALTHSRGDKLHYCTTHCTHPVTHPLHELVTLPTLALVQHLDPAVAAAVARLRHQHHKGSGV